MKKHDISGRALKWEELNSRLVVQRLFFTVVAFLVGLNPAQTQSHLGQGGILQQPPFMDPRMLAFEEFVRWPQTKPGLNRASTASPGVSFVSATSLAAPPAARKAYKKAAREMGKEKPDLVRAAAELEKAVGLYPSFAIAWYFLGGVRLVLNEADSGRRAFENALAADPKFPYAYAPLAGIELRTGRYAEAARLTESALKIDPRLFEAHYYHALSNSVLGRHDKARHSIQQILDSDNDRRYPGVHVILAVMFTNEKDFASAANEYHRFLELDPASPAAIRAREHLANWRAAALIP